MDSQKPFPWEPAQVKAAAFLAEDELTDEEIAAEVGVSRSGLVYWKSHSDFRKRILEIKDQLGDLALRRVIGRRARRVRILDEQLHRMLQIIEARAEEMKDVPGGGATGLLVRTHKTVGKGAAARIEAEFTIDTALLREIREHMKQAAQELGQWTEKRDVTTGGEPMVLVRGVPDEQL